MVVDNSRETLLPHLTLESMTKHQLEEFIPELITRVTGITSPQFGSITDKPDWWPLDLEWTHPEEFSNIYQNPCEKLREIIRSGYFHMDQDNQLDSSFLKPFNAELPTKTASTTKGVGTETTNMTVQNSDPSVIVIDDSSDVIDHKKETSSKDDDSDNQRKGCRDLENTFSKSDVNDNRNLNQTESANKHSDDSLNELYKEMCNDRSTDCSNEVACTGMSVPTKSGTQDIPEDIISQIDEQIAKSLKDALFKFKDHGSGQGSNKLSAKSTSSGYYMGSDILKNRHKVVARRHSDDAVADVKQKTPETGQMCSKTSASKGHCNDGGKQTDTVSSNCSTLKGKDDSSTKNKMQESAPVTDNVNSKDDKNDDDVVWICFICAKAFPNQSTLVEHQDVCENKSDNFSSEMVDPQPCMSSSLLSEPTLNSNSGVGNSRSVITKTPDSCAGVSKNIDQCDRETVVKPVPTLLRKVGSNIKSLPLGIPLKSKPFRINKRKFRDIYIPPSRDLYFESLNLVPTVKVEEIAKSPRKSLSEDDCQIIDLTVEETKHPLPPTPRTPKSLMSQLSRDEGSGRRRQLSFSSPSQVKTTEAEGSNDSDSSSEGSMDDVTTQLHKVPSKSAILGIPLTSPLGQRLKKHWNYENKLPIIENVESFCKTDSASVQLEEIKPKKNHMVEKLRNRPPPQCTFRFTKKYINKWFHLYKFNKADQHEFNKTLRFGLNRESRLKRKRMKPCQVSLSRLSQKIIKYWTSPKTVPRKFLPDTSSLRQYNKRMKLNHFQSAALSQRSKVMHNVSYWQMSPHMRNAGPTPQLLVRSVPVGSQGMQLHVLPLQQTPYSNNTSMCNTQRQLQSVVPREMTGSQKRKQVFTHVRDDDNMIICLSSDDEDDGKLVKNVTTTPTKLTNPCAACSINKTTCKDHGMKKKIGPASYMQHLLNKQPQQQISHSSIQKDGKLAYPANIISHKPSPTSQMYNYSNSASAKVFGNSFMSLGQNSTPSSVSRPVNGSMAKYRLSEGKIESGLVHQSALEPVISHVQSCSTQPVIKDEVPQENKEVNHEPMDSDYLNYEVICIDSDDDE
ncbi:hypothetical protein ACF0H5_015045 [Mactra antiquata]